VKRLLPGILAILIGIGYAFAVLYAGGEL